MDGAPLVSCDAFTGAGVPSGEFSQGRTQWALGEVGPVHQPQLVPEAAADPACWKDARVGWGLILPDREGADSATLGAADDAPEPIRRLVDRRGGKVLRYGAVEGLERWTLRDYAGGGDRLAVASPPGMGPKELPRYLLIYGTPEEIPWELQFSLNTARYVGRLDLDGERLENYVGALLDRWQGAQSSYAAPVVWSVDQPGDITRLMREAISAPVVAKLRDDEDITDLCYLDGSVEPATHAALNAALVHNRPALVVTTSHGLTGPLEDPGAMRAGLGLLVDQQGDVMCVDRLLEAWQPDGAIWFAQACCSAGSNAPSGYAGLFEPASTLNRVLEAVGGLGSATARLPRALLGAEKPLRAFIGRVEPTFDWTLSFPPNKQSLASHLQQALYDRLCRGLPVGLALHPQYEPIGGLYVAREQQIAGYNRCAGAAAADALDMALYSKVTAQDRSATVILGDPTVAIPPPTST
jgi:hypothetical protein